MHVGIAVVEKQLAAIAAPLITLFSERTADHLVNQTGELGADLLDKFGDA